MPKEILMVPVPYVQFSRTGTLETRRTVPVRYSNDRGRRSTKTAAKEKEKRNAETLSAPVRTHAHKPDVRRYKILGYVRAVYNVNQCREVLGRTMHVCIQ